jgi:hypothetical protein
MYTLFIEKEGDGRLSFNEIEKGFEEIDSWIFRCSLHRNFSLEQLTEIYIRLLEFKDRLLELSYIKIGIDNFEQIRFSLMEEIYMVRIFIKEKVGQDATKDVEKLKHLYGNNEKMGGIQIE